MLRVTIRSLAEIHQHINLWSDGTFRLDLAFSSTFLRNLLSFLSRTLEEDTYLSLKVYINFKLFGLDNIIKTKCYIIMSMRVIMYRVDFYLNFRSCKNVDTDNILFASSR